MFMCHHYSLADAIITDWYFPFSQRPVTLVLSVWKVLICSFRRTYLCFIRWDSPIHLKAIAERPKFSTITVMSLLIFNKCGWMAVAYNSSTVSRKGKNRENCIALKALPQLTIRRWYIVFCSLCWFYVEYF